MRSFLTLAASLCLVPVAVLAQRHPPSPPQVPSPEAAAWWAQTTALAGDSMEGRDTGTDAYERAAKYVADQFTASGLKPAGDNGSFFQRVPMHQVDLDLAHSSIEIGYLGRGHTLEPLHLVEEVTLLPRRRLATSLDAPMVFLGYGLPLPQLPLGDLSTLKGLVAVVFSNTPADLPAAERATFTARRNRALADAGVAAILSIDNPAAIEPFHWPAAYARTVTLTGASEPSSDAPLLLRISADAAPRLFAADLTHPFAALLHDGEAGAPLPSFRISAGLRIHLAITEKDISSPNILAILPGSDPALSSEYVALSAHLDGYGYGTPVLGDNLYNGALDDAAYVATLLELAKSQAALPPARRPRRSLLFCVFTGEEKGLLGSAFFTAHPTVPVSAIVADLNLDQLRPIFPLKILTMEGLDDSTLGATARTVASRFSVEIRPDREPERNLFRRADNYNFVRIGVPIASFIFGYNPASHEEAVYRDWYARRYHKPQDDLDTPIDWKAAATFNDFYKALTLAIADTPARPQWLPSSPYAPAPRPVGLDTSSHPQ